MHFAKKKTERAYSVSSACGSICLPPWSSIYRYCSTAGHRITYSVATLSYDNYHANLRDYSNF